MPEPFRLVPAGDRLEVIPVHGLRVTSCTVSYTFRLEFWEQERELWITLALPFTFSEAGVEHRLTPGEDGPALGPALALWNKTIDALFVWEAGRLEATFSDGSRLAIEPDPQYEAWEISGSGGFDLICLPGGGLADFSHSVPEGG